MPFGVDRPLLLALGVRSPSSSAVGADDEKNNGDEVVAIAPFRADSLSGLPFDLAGLPFGGSDCESEKSSGVCADGLFGVAACEDPRALLRGEDIANS